ncbi:alpha/beta fold hydrolase [Aeromicrobium sp. YIM 150415]|uniref:alpha/beta fold hydrolase n=1 Tax=Aeromicrobium sp. YIM 150415 TaxID=2803912 RepID=UPI0019652F00|nr:alpha/beta hydrolase [Aeromicrobium sp. YIM 150415]MBM9465077.1 alpha/beta fold hydrolase [Aeromicrobium sp. YIM 150415]
MSIAPSASERFAHLDSGLTLCFESWGDEDAPVVLLIMGLGSPMHLWPDGFCEQLVDRGYRVIRYDNRDTGRSTALREQQVTRLDIVRAALGIQRQVPYTLGDLADDAAGLLDRLEIDRAHIVGASMGGMVAQTFAIAHPGRTASLTSIMSTTGSRFAGWMDPRLIPMMLRPGATSREEFIAGQLAASLAIGSPGFPDDPDLVRATAELTYDRGWTSAGVTRHVLAILTQRDRRKALRSVRVPAMVVHGTEDRMVHPSGGTSTARALPQAELLKIAGMGHDLPVAAQPAVVDAIDRTARRA